MFEICFTRSEVAKGDFVGPLLWMEFKGRKERADCYEARDAFFQCHEKQPEGVESKVACKDLFEKFERACGHKWTEHFIRKHSYEKFKDKLMKGGVEVVDEKKLK